MNRQQWAIMLTGIGGLLLLTVFLMGGPEFSWECSETNGQGDCDEAFADFLFTVLWTFFAFSFGSVLLLVGVILFIIDASQHPATEDETQPSDRP